MSVQDYLAAVVVGLSIGWLISSLMRSVLGMKRYERDIAALRRAAEQRGRSRPVMDPIKKSQWCEALRSGRYKQGRDLLRAGDAFCCLGVAVDGGLTGLGWDDRSINYPALLAPLERIRLGISEEAMEELSRQNDRGVPFPDIADWIEASL